MLDEKNSPPFFPPEDDSLFGDFWAMEDASLLNQKTETLLKQCQEDIQSLLAYTLILKGVSKNPFERALNFPMHPRMNLI